MPIIYSQLEEFVALDSTVTLMQEAHLKVKRLQIENCSVRQGRYDSDKFDCETIGDYLA